MPAAAKTNPPVRRYKTGWLGPSSRRTVHKPLRGKQPARELSAVASDNGPRPVAPTPSADVRDRAPLRTVGNDHAWEQAERWLDGALRETGAAPLLLSGPSGCGKTSGVRELVARAGRLVVELNGPDATSAAHLCDELHDACTRGGIDGPPPVVVVEDVDGVPTSATAGLIRFLARVPPNATAVVLISASVLPLPLVAIRSAVVPVSLQPLTEDHLLAVARRREPELAAGLSAFALRNCAARARGDARQMLFHVAWTVGAKASAPARAHAVAAGRRDSLCQDVFSAARRLLYGRVTSDDAEHIMREHEASSWFEDLLFANYLLAAHDRSRTTGPDLAAVSDALSTAETLRQGPARARTAPSLVLWAAAVHGPRAELEPRQKLEMPGRNPSSTGGPSFPPMSIEFSRLVG